jgi:zinc protease
MERTRILASFVVTALAAGSALAQETSGVNTGENPGAVIKGKAPVAKDLPKIRFPKPKAFTLSNGVKVYVLEDHRAPTVRFSLQIRAGTLYELKPGVAGLTASMLTEGSTSRSDVQIAEDSEDIGAFVNASAGLELATLTAAGLSESTDRLLALMSDVLLHPSFPNPRLDRVKFAERSAFSQRLTSPAAILGDLTTQVFYGGTPYAHLTPNRQQLAALTPEDLKSFYQRFYVPDGAVLGVTGDVNLGALKTKLETSLGSWKSRGSDAVLPTADFKPKPASNIYFVDRPGSAQTVLQFGSLAVKQTDPDYIPLVVANRILGGGSSGRLFQNIRERKGYTYGAYSTIGATKWPAVWGANASVRTAVTEPAIGEFFKEFARLQNEPVPPAELSDAKRSIVGGFALTLQSPEGILARTLDQVQNDLPRDYWDTYPQRIDRVSAADVQRVAKKYLSANQIQLLVVGEGKTIRPALEKFAPVHPVDPLNMSSIASQG